MTVSREELKAATDLLSKKIDDNNNNVIGKWDKLADSIDGMNTNIGRFIEKFNHQEKANKRLSDDITRIQDKQHTMSEDIVALKTNQANSKNFWDKFGVPVMFLAIAGLTTINYFKT
jgi:hypothetical protein|tara:strand:+ start:530 stop:880 length:351 start_codon:yes stop_codon:yes gene_type:complete